jgi:hypothetical protein
MEMLSPSKDNNFFQIRIVIHSRYFDVFLTVHHNIDLFHLPILMHNFYSLTIYMLYYNPRHVSGINMPIFRRKNCIITASGILHFTVQKVTIPDVVITQFVLLKMDILMLETFRGL